MSMLMKLNNASFYYIQNDSNKSTVLICSKSYDHSNIYDSSLSFPKSSRSAHSGQIYRIAQHVSCNLKNAY
jgi:hypothetical protein